MRVLVYGAGGVGAFSTMVDRERGRTMEADALIGVIVRKGRDAGVPAPASAALYALMKAIDDRV